MIYKLTITIGDQFYEFETEDLLKTFLEFKPKKLNFYTKIKVEYEGRTVERLVKVWRAKQIFSNERAAQFFIKTLITGL